MPRKAVAKMQTSASAGLRQPVSPDLAMHAPSASSSAAYQRLSENGQLYAWLIFGGMIVGGFFFGIVAGYQRAPVIQYSAESRTNSTEKKPSTAESGDKRTNKDPAPTSETSNTGTSSQTPVNPSDRNNKGTTPPDALAKTKESTAPSSRPTPPSKMEQASNLPPPNPSPVANNPPPKTPESPPKKETSSSPPANLTPVSFQKDVLPIFRTYCLNCHGAGSGKPKGNVDLRTVAAIMKGGGAPILVVGQPEKSAIYTTIEDMSMPPDGKRPTPQELAIIRNWILTGAKE